MANTSQLKTWVNAGLIDETQAGRIREFETDQQRHSGAGRDVLAYLGAVLVLAASLVVTAEIWPEISTASQAVMAAIATGILTTVGMMLVRSERVSTQRVGHAALLLGSAAIWTTAYVLAEAAAEPELAATIAFAISLAYSAVFYLRYRTWAQHAALFGTTIGIAIASTETVFDADTVAVVGVVIFVIGSAWTALSTMQRITPEVLGETLGIIAALIGSAIIVGETDPKTAGGAVAILAFIALAAVLVGVGVARDRVTFILGGVAGLLLYLPWLVNERLSGGIGAPLAMLIAGGILIGVAVLLTRRAGKSS